MNYSESNPSEESQKSYQCPSGPLAWLNDIEITKWPYLTSIVLLVMNIIFVRQAFFTIDIPYMDSMTFALHEIKELSGFGFVALILGGLSVFTLLVPLVKFFEWKYMWFIPTAATALVETVAALYLIARKNELMKNSLIGYAYELLSIEINLTPAAWMLIAVNIVLLAFSAKMMRDLKRNEMLYS